MTDEPLPALESLGEEFKRLGEGPRLRRARARRAGVLAVAAALLLAAAATAAILITRGAPLSAPRPQDLQSSGVPLPGSARLAGLAAADPDASAPPWDVRLSRTAAGETCTAVGQVVAGQFGILGLDGVFRALPLGGVDACGIASPGGPVLAGARVLLGTDAQQARTVVNGVAGPGTRSVTAYGPDGARALRLGPQGSFLTVYRGYVEDVRPRIEVETADGRRHRVDFASSSAFEVADPAGGPPWTVSGGPSLQPGSYPDESCAQASRELGRDDPTPLDSPLTPDVCGRLGKLPLLASMRRFVPGARGPAGFPWGNNPARTLVYGAAAPRVASLLLTGPGIHQPLPIDARGGGAFLAVLDGHRDPRALTLTARLRDGRTLTFTRSTGLLDPEHNRPLATLPVPAYREPLPARQTRPLPFELPIAASARETLQASDPAGGPPWALRSWQGTPNPRANFGGQRPSRFYCLQVGVIERGVLVDPRPSAAPTPLTLGTQSGLGGCNDGQNLLRSGSLAEVVSYPQDPYAYAPRVLRTVVSGQLPRGAGAPVLLGAGAASPLRVDANGAFLAVLPGRYWHARLEVSAVIGGRRVVRSTANPFPGPPAPATPQARAPDPEGGAPWGFSLGSDGSTSFGRIVEGRLASIDAASGILRDGAEGWSGGGHPVPTRRRPPVVFGNEGGPAVRRPDQSPPALTRPEVERRTLPGTTIITGRARGDVASITLVTPRDVRTIRPSGPEHVFIVVYDGQFFRGSATASIRLRDGRTVTESIMTGLAGIRISPPQPPSLAVLLQNAEGELTRIVRQPSHRGRAAQRRRAINALTGIVGVMKRRIAYQAAHPGLLPPS